MTESDFDLKNNDYSFSQIMKMKKILVLGANQKQIQLISAAKSVGYYVIVCDYTKDHPGIPLADKHYQISYLDKDAVLAVAQSEHIDGIIGNTDPAMMMVAYISEQLGLVGNKPGSIEQMLSKAQFRKLQEEVGLYCPKHIETDIFSEIESSLDDLVYPIVIKPSISNSSQGTTKIPASNLREKVRESFQKCKEISRNGKVLVEEFVEMPSMEVIEGDVFINDDTILYNLFTTRRSVLAPMVPMTYIFPPILSEEKKDIVKSGLGKIFKGAGIKHGEYNVEMYFTTKNELFIIEINPRQGGHDIPQLIQLYTGIDYNKLLVTTAVGDFEYFSQIKGENSSSDYITHHVVFPKYTGIFDKLNISPEIEKYVISTHIRENLAHVSQCENGTDWVASYTMRFPDRDTQLRYSGEQIEQYLYVDVKECQIPIVDCAMSYRLVYNFMVADAYDFFVPKLLKVNRTPEDYAEQIASYCTIAYDIDEKNQIIGMVAGYTHNLRIPDWSLIAEVYVNSDQRGKGLGEKLLYSYINYCKSIHLKGVWLHVKEDNKSAQRLYKKIGFVIDETYNENGFLKMDLRICDVVE